MSQRNILLGCGVIAVVALLAFWQAKPPEPKAPNPSASGGNIALVQVPQVKGDAVIGQRIFESACAACHGVNAAGLDGSGPPLVHKIYEPNHHGDESFYRAASLGVQSHHWPFGDMPPVKGLTRADVTMVIEYIRQLQRANGIN